MMEILDVVICVAEKDCYIVKKNIPYIAKNLRSNNIYLITSNKNSKRFNKKMLERYNAHLIDENSLVPGLSFDILKNQMITLIPNVKCYGWYFQQFLKMAFSYSKYAKNRYLIWDADTFPLNLIDFYKDGKYIFTEKTEYHKPYFDTIYKLLGLNKIVDFSFIAEHMIIDVSIMKKLIHHIDESNVKGNIWHEKILHCIKSDCWLAFSEFETYGTYCYQYHREIMLFRELRTLRRAGKLYGRNVKVKELELLSKSFDTASFELQDMPPFPKILIQWNQLYYYVKRQLGFKTIHERIFGLLKKWFKLL